MQERLNCSALVTELRLSCTNPLKYEVTNNISYKGVMGVSTVTIFEQISHAIRRLKYAKLDIWTCHPGYSTHDILSTMEWSRPIFHPSDRCLIICCNFYRMWLKMNMSLADPSLAVNLSLRVWCVHECISTMATSVIIVYKNTYF